MKRAKVVSGTLSGCILLTLLTACSGSPAPSPTAVPAAPTTAPAAAPASPTVAAAAPAAPTAPPPTAAPPPTQAASPVASPTRAVSPSPSPSPARAASPVASPASAASPAAASGPAPGFTRFDGSAAGFTIDYPQAWSVDRSNENVVVFNAPDGEARFSVASVNTGGTLGLDEFASDFIKQTNFNITGTVEAVTLAGQPARIALWTGRTEAGDATEGAMFFVNRSPWSHALTGSSTTKSGRTHDNSLSGLLDSFRLVSPGQPAGAAAPAAPPASAPPPPAAAGSPASAPSFSVHDGSAAGFLIAYPQGWTVDTSRENVVSFASPEGDGNFSVAALNVGNVGLDEFMTSFLQSTPFTVAGTQPAAVAGVDAKVAGWTSTNAAGAPTAGGTYFVTKAPWAYALTGTSLASVGDKYNTIFDAMVTSFTFVP